MYIYFFIYLPLYSEVRNVVVIKYLTEDFVGKTQHSNETKNVINLLFNTKCKFAHKKTDIYLPCPEKSIDHLWSFLLEDIFLY